MNCTEFKNTLINVDHLADQSVSDSDSDGLSVEQQMAFDAHRKSCGNCQRSYEAEIALVTALREMPVPGPSADFADRVLRTAVTQTEIKDGGPNAGHHHRHGFLLGFGSATAAALALWVVVGIFPKAVPPVGDLSGESIASLESAATTRDVSEPEISIALHQQQDVKLAFHTVTALQGARITIQIPENVALAGYPGQRELSWETNLNEGENLLRLPLVASQAMKGQLVARIEHGKRVRTLRVNLKAGIPGVSGQGVLIEQLV